VGHQRGWVVEVDEPAWPMAGRVAVQLDWAYQGEGASPSHCWLPLAPGLAARALSVMMEGTEVLVSFIEGDPDRPMISAFFDVPTRPYPPKETSCQTLPSSHADPVLLSSIQAAEPLVLLCLLPGGGTFSSCPQPVCTCRLVTRRDASAAP